MSRKSKHGKAGIRARLHALKLAARQRFRPRVVTIGGVRVPSDPAMMPDEVIELIYQERWEAAEARMCREALRAGDRVLEIGAGIGFIGSLCARICGSENVLSYEANPRLEPLIRRTHALNRVSPMLRMRAIAAASGKTTLFMNDNIMSSSLVDRGFGGESTVESDALSDVLAEFRPTVIVCDIEGAEVDVLPAADLSSIDRLVIELHPKLVGAERNEALIRALSGQGLAFSSGTTSKLALFVNKTPSSRERDMRRDTAFMSFYRRCAPNSMTSMERLFGLYTAVSYLQANGIKGDIVECGVWRGGSMMMSALSLMHFEGADRHLYLFDTYEGMPEPTAEDHKFGGGPAHEKWRSMRTETGSDWNYASLEDVRALMLSTGYPADRLHFVKGKVEETVPEHAPARIAMLRLDTDFYASTLHELVTLYPRLSRCGVLIIDDFGTWAGAAQATKEYFEQNNVTMLLSRLDPGGRVGVKTEPASWQHAGETAT